MVAEMFATGPLLAVTRTPIFQRCVRASPKPGPSAERARLHANSHNPIATNLLDHRTGVTCHASRDLAMQAGEDGADYVAFGAFFPTDTKDGTAEAEPEILQWWSELMELPVVAIGGINAANCAPLVKAGANFLAVIGAVWNHPDGPAAGVKAMNAAITLA